MKIKKILLFVSICLSLFFKDALVFAAEDVQELLSVLVKKGIVTKEDLNSMNTIKKSDKDKLRVQESCSTKGFQEQSKRDKSEAPEWIKNTKVKGDFRLRYQSQGRDDSITRNRERVRLRVGFETDINQDLKVGARIVTGGTDPRSTNQTFQDTFETKSLMLDRAYVKYTPYENLEVIAGKFGNPFFGTNGFLWDSDIAFEGQAVKFNTEINEDMELFFNAGLFVLDEYTNSSKDPIMYVLQPGFERKIGDALKWKIALTYYGFKSVQGRTLDHSAGTNTLNAGSLEYKYDAINLTNKLTYNWKNKKEQDFAVSFIVDYVKNPDSQDEGYLVGFKYGHKKLEKAGQWEGFYNWRHLERDAFLDVFPNADFYGGKTNVQGHELGLKYVLVENMYLGLAYYYTEDIDNINIEEHLFQADLLVNF